MCYFIYQQDRGHRAVVEVTHRVESDPEGARREAFISLEKWLVYLSGLWFPREKSVDPLEEVKGALILK